MKKLYKDLTNKQKDLIDEAQKVIVNAYDPYSNFYVWASVKTNKWNIYKWININLAAYWWLCAERIALSTAISNWEYQFESIAIFPKSDFFEINLHSWPCWICRQFIWEFCELQKKDIEILISDSKKEKIMITSIKKLHPIWFGPRLCFWEYERYLK